MFVMTSTWAHNRQDTKHHYLQNDRLQSWQTIFVVVHVNSFKDSKRRSFPEPSWLEWNKQKTQKDSQQFFTPARLYFVKIWHSVQFSPLTNWVKGRHDRRFSRDPLPVFSAGGPCKQFWHRQIFPPRCPRGWFWIGCRSVWHARTMQVSISWQLPEDFSADPQGSYFAPHPFVGHVFQVGDTEEFPHALGFESLVPFFQSQQAGSVWHSRERGWRWQETCRTWTCLQSSWCCTARSYLVWSKNTQSTGLLPGTWNWSPSLTSCHSTLIKSICTVCALLFSVLTSIPYAVALSTSLSVRSWNLQQIEDCLWTFHQWRWMCGVMFCFLHDLL